MKRTRFFIIGLALSLTGSLYAQDGLDLEDSAFESLSPQERIDSGAASIDKMKGVRDQGVSLLTKTRKEEKDIIKLNCINEKLSAVKGFLKVGEQAFVELQEEIEEKDEQGQIHQSKLIQLAERRVLPLGDEMAACAGDSIQYTGPTDLDVTIEDNVRTDNPTSGQADDQFDLILIDDDLDRLPELTPYQ